MSATFDDDRPALIEADTGRVLSHRDLHREVDAAAETMAGRKSLMMLAIDHTTAAVVAYLAARRCGHAVMILPAALDRARIDALAERYRPELSWPADLGPAAPPGTGGPLHPELSHLLPTSGSTGSPKMVRLSATNVAANTAAIARSLDLQPADRAVTSLPLSYSYGLSVLNSHLHAGATVVLTSASVVERRFWEIVADQRVTSLAGVPYTFQMLERVGFAGMDLPRLTTLTQAGGRLSDELIGSYHQTMVARGGRLYVMYGQTEASPRMTCLPPGWLPAKTGSVGVALDGGRLQIRTDDGRLTSEAGVEGEVVYRGPNVMMGYADSRPDLADGDVTGGVLHTGDIGHLDPDGCLWLTGRSKRIAKLYGVRVSLDDVEKLFDSCAPVAAVAGDDTVSVHHEGADPSALREARLAAARTLRVPPSAIRLVGHDTGLPTTANGKVDYRRLGPGR